MAIYKYVDLVKQDTVLFINMKYMYITNEVKPTVPKDGHAYTLYNKHLGRVYIIKKN